MAKRGMTTAEMREHRAKKGIGKNAKPAPKPPARKPVMNKPPARKPAAKTPTYRPAPNPPSDPGTSSPRPLPDFSNPSKGAVEQMPRVRGGGKKRPSKGKNRIPEQSTPKGTGPKKAPKKSPKGKKMPFELLERFKGKSTAKGTKKAIGGKAMERRASRRAAKKK
jgi:hypothetical protein